VEGRRTRREGERGGKENVQGKVVEGGQTKESRYKIQRRAKISLEGKKKRCVRRKDPFYSLFLVFPLFFFSSLFFFSLPSDIPGHREENLRSGTAQKNTRRKDPEEGK